ncbi:MAG: tyrosine-type recombinase/integrase [Phycisphaeraceae bacterium]
MVKGSTREKQRKAAPKRQTDYALPWPTFPLSPHPSSGRWYKKHKGRRHYFGKLADGWEAAYAKYEAEWPDIVAGREQQPTSSREGLTLREGVNLWLAARVEDGNAGTIAASTVSAYHRIGRQVVDELGGGVPISRLKPDDFRRLAHTYRGTMAPTPARKAFVVTRQIFTWLFHNEHIDAPPRYGTDFKLSKLESRRTSRRSNGATFTAEQVRTLLHAAQHGVAGDSDRGIEGVRGTPHLYAMVLLAINGGYTQRELAMLRLDDVDIENAIIDHYRGKSEARRTVPLWPETVEALKASIANRPTPKREAEGLLFVTANGMAWQRERMIERKPEKAGDKAELRFQRVDAIAHQFAKLCKATGARVEGAGFGHLRHTHRTISDEAGDPHAAMRIMGHDVPGISRHYVADISRERLEAVANHVRGWLWPEQPAKKKTTKKKAGKKAATKRSK